MNWAIFKKLNSKLTIPINEQLYLPHVFGRRYMYAGTATFTVSITGWYIITCVGKGGNGYGGMTGGSSGDYGGGGGGGAVTRGAYYLKKGEQYAISVDITSSTFGELISAGAGTDGAKNTAGTGGRCLIPGNIFAYDGKDANETTGGNAGTTTPWSMVQSGAGKGFLPFMNDKISGGFRGTSDSTAGGEGFWGGGNGGAYDTNSSEGQPGAGGGGYGGGGQGGENDERAGYTNRAFASPGLGGEGIIIIEYGTELQGKA